MACKRLATDFIIIYSVYIALLNNINRSNNFGANCYNNRSAMNKGHMQMHFFLDTNRRCTNRRVSLTIRQAWGKHRLAHPLFSRHHCQIKYTGTKRFIGREKKVGRRQRKSRSFADEIALRSDAFNKLNFSNRLSVIPQLLAWSLASDWI